MARWNNGLDIDEYVDRYINNHLESLKGDEIDNLSSCLEGEDFEKAKQEIDSISDVDDFKSYFGYDALRYIYEQVAEELERDYDNQFYNFINHLKDLFKCKRDGFFDFDYTESNSWCPGRFRSVYITIYHEDDDLNFFEKREIRFCDGHDNGRNNSDAEVNFENLMNDSINYYDDDINDLLDEIIDEWEEETCQ